MIFEYTYFWERSQVFDGENLSKESVINLLSKCYSSPLQQTAHPWMREYSLAFLLGFYTLGKFNLSILSQKEG